MLKFAPERVRELREARKLSQTMLAGLCGVTETAVRGWESGRAAPGFASGVQLARTLGVEPAELLVEEAA